MSEIEKTKGKDSWLDSFQHSRPDLFYPDVWTEEEQAEVAEMVRPSRLKTSLFSSIPMTCRARKCPVAEICPLLKKGLAPEGMPCHTPGTLINTMDGPIPIEELDSSKHKLWAWEKNHNAIRRRGGFSFSLTKKHFNDLIVRIYAGADVHEVTYNHISAVRFSERAHSAFCVYLMRKGDFWRIGKTRLVRISPSTGKAQFGPGARAYIEKADELWVLGVYNSNTEALLAEEYFSCLGQIPKASFIDSSHRSETKWDGLYKWVAKEQLRNHHKSLLQDENHYKGFLRSLGLSIDYPIWRKLKDTKDPVNSRPLARRSMFIRSCNILSGYMEVPCIPEKPMYNDTKQVALAEWRPVITEVEEYHGSVYSLDVEKHKTYFANNIATHNCPIELGIVIEFSNSLMRELNVDEENMTEVSMIRDLVDLEIQQMRVTKRLSLEDFIQDSVIGINENTGEPIIRKELHQAVELNSRVLKNKKELRNQLLASREARARVGQGVTDSSQLISNIYEQIREIDIENEKLLKRKLKQMEALDAEVVDEGE